MDNISIVSMNCCGLASRDKRKEVFQYLKLNKFHICCLQDTHFVTNEKDNLRKEWGNESWGFPAVNRPTRGELLFYSVKVWKQRYWEYAKIMKEIL